MFLQNLCGLVGKFSREAVWNDVRWHEVHQLAEQAHLSALHHTVRLKTRHIYAFFQLGHADGTQNAHILHAVNVPCGFQTVS